MHRTIVAVATVLLVLSVPGCGDRDAGPTGADPTDESTKPTSPSTAHARSTAATTPPSEALEKIRVVGEVIEVGDCVVVE